MIKKLKGDNSILLQLFVWDLYELYRWQYCTGDQHFELRNLYPAHSNMGRIDSQC